MGGNMKYYKEIVLFRRAYRKLHYEKGKIALLAVREWCLQWCKDNNVEQENICYYIDLADAYADKDISEKLFYDWLKKQKR